MVFVMMESAGRLGRGGRCVQGYDFRTYAGVLHGVENRGGEPSGYICTQPDLLSQKEKKVKPTQRGAIMSIGMIEVEEVISNPDLDTMVE